MYRTIIKIIKHRDKKGMKGLLPQNIPDDILHLILDDMTMYSSKELSYTFLPESLSILVFITTSIRYNYKYDDVTCNEITDLVELDKFLTLDDVNRYTTALLLEKFRREKIISIPKSSMPTIKTMFEHEENDNKHIDVLDYFR